MPRNSTKMQKTWQEIDHKKEKFLIVWELKNVCVSQIFTIVFMSVKDCKSAVSIDFRVTNKL